MQRKHDFACSLDHERRRVVRVKPHDHPPESQHSRQALPFSMQGYKSREVDISEINFYFLSLLLRAACLTNDGTAESV